jgi:hypothetical protein
LRHDSSLHQVKLAFSSPGISPAGLVAVF